MTTSTIVPSAAKVRVLCVDDNEHVAEAIRIKLQMSGSVDWLGRLPDASELADRVATLLPDVVLLDLDMPGPNPLTVARKLASDHPCSRVLVLSGHLTRGLIEQALEAGAWGYVYKGEDVSEVVRAVHVVKSGEVALSPDAQAAFIAP